MQKKTKLVSCGSDFRTKVNVEFLEKSNCKLLANKSRNTVMPAQFGATYHIIYMIDEIQ